MAHKLLAAMDHSHQCHNPSKDDVFGRKRMQAPESSTFVGPVFETYLPMDPMAFGQKQNASTRALHIHQPPALSAHCTPWLPVQWYIDQQDAEMR